MQGVDARKTLQALGRIGCSAQPAAQEAPKQSPAAQTQSQAAQKQSQAAQHQSQAVNVHANISKL
tara:strand:+ start:91 stop:285 length:195 start_codon:yes stop_codon:yes gene_type:complete